jgi:predicted small secreted protein
MKNTLINKKVVAVIAGSIMSLSSLSFSTGIFVAGAVIVMPSTVHAASKKVERQMRKAERLEKKSKKAEEKWKATQKKEFEKESKSGVIANCGAPGQLPCN